MAMSPNNMKIALGVAGVSTAAIATGGIVNAISDKNTSKERTEALSNIKGNSKQARKQRIQINKDFNKEEKSIDYTIGLATAGAIAASGIAGFGLSKML